MTDSVSRGVLLDSIHKTIQQQGHQPTPTNVFACVITLLRSNCFDSATLNVLVPVFRGIIRHVSDNLLSSQSADLFLLLGQLVRKESHMNVRNLWSLLHDLVDRLSEFRDDSMVLLEPEVNAAEGIIVSYMQLLNHFFITVKNRNIAEKIKLTQRSWNYLFETLLHTHSHTVVSKAVGVIAVYFDNILSSATIENTPFLQELVSAFCDALSPDYSNRWKELLEVLASLLCSVSIIKQERNVSQSLKDGIELCLAKAVQLRDVSSQLSTEAENLIKSCALCLPALEILKVIRVDIVPMKSTELLPGPVPSKSEVLRRKYVLDILKKSVSFDSLSYFANDLVPLASVYMELADEQASQGLTAQSRQWRAMHEKIWELAPSFFISPIEFTEENVRSVVKKLVLFLENSEMRHIACRAFCRMSADTYKISNHTRPIIPILHRLSHFVLPRLCNLYEEFSLDYVAEAVRSVATVSHANTISQICATLRPHIFPFKETPCLTKASDVIRTALCIAPVTNDEVRRTWAELTLNILESHLKCSMSEHCKNLKLENSVRTSVNICLSPLLEKQYYRLLAELLSDKKLPQSFILRVVAHFSETVPLPFHAPTRKHRLLGVDSLLQYLSDNDCRSELPDFCESVTPELVLSTQEICTKTRERALSLIAAISKIVGPQSYLECLQLGFSLPLSPVLCGTLTACAKTYWSHHRELPQRTHESMWVMVLTCLELPTGASPTTQDLPLATRNSAFAFLRMLIKLSYHHDPTHSLLQAHLRRVVQAVYHWVDRTDPLINQRSASVTTPSATRQIVRVLLEKLLKRLGAEPVLSCLPLSGQRLGRYIAKQLERKHRIQARGSASTLSGVDRVSMKAQEGYTLRDTNEDEDIALDMSMGDGVLRHMKTGGGRTRDNALKGEQSIPLGNSDDEEFNVRVNEQGQIVVKEITRNHKDSFRTLKRERDAEEEFHHESVSDLDADSGRQRKRSKRYPSTGIANDELSGENHNKEYMSETARDKPKAILLAEFRQRYNTKNKKSIRDSTKRIHSGKNYASKNAGGDVKRKGQLDPYAYVPLDRRLLNKRLQGANKKHFLENSRFPQKYKK